MPNAGLLTAIQSDFCRQYDIKFPIYLGAMANGIASETLVCAAANAYYLAIFGSAGLSVEQVSQAIQRCSQNPNFHRIGFNLIHMPDAPDLEVQLVKLFIAQNVHIIEASAYILPSPALALYKASGLYLDNGLIRSRNRIIAKLSRTEVAEKFLIPPPASHLNQWVNCGLISEEQRDWALLRPLADEITVEADSGGHTDRQSLVSILPIIVSTRNRLCAALAESDRPRIGAAGGIGTPHSILAAFELGAQYVVTGSINQCTIESGTSSSVKAMLSTARSTDTMMAVSADMFEMGSKVQVLKGKSLFAPRAEKLYQLYTQFDSFDDIPNDIRTKMESQLIGDTWESVWEKCVIFWKNRNPKLLENAETSPKKRMALLFKYYLGMSSRWAIDGVVGKESNYQIWCGQSMGAFNHWVSDTPLSKWENRSVAAITDALVTETIRLHTLRTAARQGVPVSPLELECKPLNG